MKKYKHKWKLDRNGQYCKLCESRVNTQKNPGYIERDLDGVLIPVSHYPKCNPLKVTVS